MYPKELGVESMEDFLQAVKQIFPPDERDEGED